MCCVTDPVIESMGQPPARSLPGSPASISALPAGVYAQWAYDRSETVTFQEGGPLTPLAPRKGRQGRSMGVVRGWISGRGPFPQGVDEFAEVIAGAGGGRGRVP